MSGLGRIAVGLINREKEAALSHDFLRSIIAYCPETGIFKWREKRGVNGRSDRHAGYVMANGYRVIRVDYSKFLAHRLAWFYMHSEWPEEEIDHINLVKDDNRITNLREASRAGNCRNVGIKKHNKLGVKGVHRHSQCRNRFVANITINAKTTYLGIFDTAEDAHQAYAEASIKHHGTFGKVA